MARRRLNPPLTEDFRNAYSIWPHGEEAHWAERLRVGLSRMVENFSAYICPSCDGVGQRRQMYNAGCGQGYYHAMGACEYCNGTGLRQGGVPAPSSVRNQVLVAAEKEDA